MLPTYVTKKNMILCKAAPTIRNAYEIRLALFMAKKEGLTFILAVPQHTAVDSALEAHIVQHGGRVTRDSITDHSVYVGALDSEGNELEGWVAGSNETWSSILATIRSLRLKRKLSVGSLISISELPKIIHEIASETICAVNIDDEDMKQALLRLASEAFDHSGSIYIQ